MHRECLGSHILALSISVINNTNLQQNPPLLEHSVRFATCIPLLVCPCPNVELLARTALLRLTSPPYQILIALLCTGIS